MHAGFLSTEADRLLCARESYQSNQWTNLIGSRNRTGFGKLLAPTFPVPVPKGDCPIGDFILAELKAHGESPVIWNTDDVLRRLRGSEFDVVFLSEGFAHVRSAFESFESSTDFLRTLYLKGKETGHCSVLPPLLVQSSLDERTAILFKGNQGQQSLPLDSFDSFLTALHGIRCTVVDQSEAAWNDFRRTIATGIPMQRSGTKQEMVNKYLALTQCPAESPLRSQLLRLLVENQARMHPKDAALQLMSLLLDNPQTNGLEDLDGAFDPDRLKEIMGPRRFFDAVMRCRKSVMWVRNSGMKTLIRAEHGHRFPVSFDWLEPLEETYPLHHGTFLDTLPLIVEGGLSSMTRTGVYFSRMRSEGFPFIVGLGVGAVFAWLASCRRLSSSLVACRRRRVSNLLPLGEAFASDFAWMRHMLVCAAIPL